MLPKTFCTNGEIEVRVAKKDFAPDWGLEGVLPKKYYAPDRVLMRALQKKNRTRLVLEACVAKNIPHPWGSQAVCCQKKMSHPIGARGRVALKITP